ncbi:helix-turn-helix transcriptional regulator [Alkalihalobacillus sp. LMS6]|uniref:helix-turn-helix transcriptional regulator n=1 Tax=Bacillaceae TaxID=186817 RepID=UPI000C07AC1D|nr:MULTISPECIES: helix-turn-helix transcriptional regulator [Bacillaceae]UTR06430.1 helix-turn-helix transcriptional regulator [Alkalihalobacillus sp. LMS6]
MSEISYTTEEIAKHLKVSKLTVYDLIKKGKLPSYRVGKQMRIDHADLEAYKNKQKQIDSPLSDSQTKQASRQHDQLIISGQDICLDILSRYFDQESHYRTLRSYQGSLNSLVSMYKGECDIVSLHLFDGESQTYNLPYVKRLLTGRSYIMIHVVKRQAGFYVQDGNPKDLTSWRDLGQAGLTMVNREKGSGARVLLDEQLSLHQINHSRIKGYNHEESTHLGVASLVKEKQADVGVGIEKAAQTTGTTFIPLIEESYDLVILRNERTEPIIETCLSILNSSAFKNELSRLGGYNVECTGEIIYQRA